MSDKDEIREALASFRFALDAERFDDMATMLTPDGVTARVPAEPSVGR